jgi:ABC-2 type transport system permease protein
MASANNLQLLDERGWRQGFANLFHKENWEWWHTRRWWAQSLLWLFIVNGLLAYALWVAPVADPTEVVMDAAEKLGGFTQLMGWFPMYAVIVITQGAIISEKQSGTAAWILSAPVSRSGFILSKFIANAIGFLGTIIILQGLVAYVQISLSEGRLLPLGLFLPNLALLSLYLLFYLALTLMLGTFFNTRGPVVGIGIGVAIGSMFNIGQAFADSMPWLVLILPEALPTLVSAFVQGESITAIWLVPIIVISLYIVLFVALAIWRFQREEF